MLQYATELAADEYGEEAGKDTVAGLLLSTGEEDYDEAGQLLLPLVQRLFDDAGVNYARMSSRGEHYSIAEDAVQEFLNWFNMPWE